MRGSSVECLRRIGCCITAWQEFLPNGPQARRTHTSCRKTLSNKPLDPQTSPNRLEDDPALVLLKVREDGGPVFRVARGVPGGDRAKTSANATP